MTGPDASDERASFRQCLQSGSVPPVEADCVLYADLTGGVVAPSPWIAHQARLSAST